MEHRNMKRKVKITEIAGQTGLRKVGTVLSVEKKIAEEWVKLGIVEYVKKPKPKAKTKK